MRKVPKTVSGGNRESLHLRMNGHWSGYYGRLSGKPVAVHFNTPDQRFDHVSVMVMNRCVWSEPPEESIGRVVDL